jgi:KDO2-lipid IV(A) lauroyltransferase
MGFLLYRKDRDQALASLGTAFPHLTEKERLSLARDCFRHLGQSALELACIRQIDRRIESLVEWPEGDRQILEAAIKRGKGVVFVSGHIGNWELLARRVALAGFPSQSIAKEASDPRTTKMIERFRQQGRVGSIWRGQPGAAKQMLRALKAGEILGLVIDQDTKVQSLFVPFFGRPAATPRAPADLALRTGAAVVVGVCQRQKDGRYRLTMREIEPRSTGDKEVDAVWLTAALSSALEEAIRRAPEQWVWMHRRWKTQP